MTLTVRVAAAEDAEAVAALVQSSYRGEESRRGWTTEADLIGGQRTDPAMVRDLVTSPESVVLVATEQDGTLVACCHVARRPGAGYLGMFAVRPGRQGNGYGRAMLDAAERHVREAWAGDRLELTVLNHRPELMAWYERCGFVRTGEEHDFPYGDERYGRPRRDDLVLLEMAKDLAAEQVTDVQEPAPHRSA